MSVDNRQLLINYRDEVVALSCRNEDGLDRISRRGKMLISSLCGDKSEYLTDFYEINLRLHNVYSSFSSIDTDYEKGYWKPAKDKLINLINTIVEHEQLFGNAFKKDSSNKAKPSQKSNQVFIVHGHDESTKSNVARFVERLGLKGIVLHEQANKGKTIIEKLEEYAAVSCFAIVLLTADDIGHSQNKEAEVKPRARQNVIFELGYFCGVLDRKNVCVLRQEGVEIPNDYVGVVYITLDTVGAWQLALAKEMQSAGIDFDMNRVSE